MFCKSSCIFPLVVKVLHKHVTFIISAKLVLNCATDISKKVYNTHNNKYSFYFGSIVFIYHSKSDQQKRYEVWIII